MSANAYAVAPHDIRRVREPNDTFDRAAARSESLARLRQWLAADFQLVDGNSGELVHTGGAPFAGDWGLRGQVCRAVFARGKAEIIEEEGAIVVLAIPLGESGG